MRGFKRILLRALLFLVVTAMLSAAAIEPLYHTDFKYYCDAQLRRSLAGSLDYLLVGASNGYAAFVPSVADEIMGVSSYNLSGGMLTWYGRRILLEKELERNPVKTVAFEISYNSLWRDYHDAWGDSCTFPRFDTVSERLRFFCVNTSVKEWDHIYANLISEGLDFYGALIKNKLFGKNEPMHNVDPADKGFHAKYNSLKVEPQDLQIGVGQLDTGFVQKNLDELYAMIHLCKQKGIETLLVVVPISDYLIYKYDNWDELERKWQALSEQTDSPLFDFNLLRSRYATLHDADAFSDIVHMSEPGARAFTAEYAKVMELYRSGADYANLFYPDYVSMRADSPYLQQETALAE